MDAKWVSKTIDNVTCRFGDDIAGFLGKDATVYIASKSFSLSAFERLAKGLEEAKEVRFVFTVPSFVPKTVVSEQIQHKRREFFIPGSGEESVFWTEHEIRLRNRMMLKAVAKRCGKWLRQRNVKFASVTDVGQMQSSLVIETKDGCVAYVPFEGFTPDVLGYEPRKYGPQMTTRVVKEATEQWLNRFREQFASGHLQSVTEELAEYISSVYRDNEPELVYFLVLRYLFEKSLKDFDEDTMPNADIGYEKTVTWQKLFEFQKDAAVAIVNKLEKYQGCILADSVGLGKTFTALAVIKYYELRNKNVLVLCPRKLVDNWDCYNKPMYADNMLAGDKLRYDVLCHTDVQRSDGRSATGIDLAKINWGAFDLVVIDESHNFRNNRSDYSDRETRWQLLARKVMREGVKTKLLMLSATPVNNRFTDLKNQLVLAYGGSAEEMEKKLGRGNRRVETIFRDAEAAFRKWSEDKECEHTSEELFKALPQDFLELVDAVTIARSRKHIERFYDTAAIGKFPEHRAPMNEQCSLSTEPGAVQFMELNDDIKGLNFSVYRPTKYIHESRKQYYDEIMLTQTKRGGSIHQSGREDTLIKLMAVNLLKRLESSVYSFRATLERILDRNKQLLCNLERGESIEAQTFDEVDDDADELAELIVGSHGISYKDLDAETYKRDLYSDINKIEDILRKIKPIDAAHDAKLKRLQEIIAHKAAHPFNKGNRKVLVFSAFADTAGYLYDQLAATLKQEYGLESGIVDGTSTRKSTLAFGIRNFQEVLARFSPVSKECPKYAEKGQYIDVLFGTDCISEGQNLQDCDCVVNYDIHWNPVRVVQRFGRVDRIGSKNSSVQLINFWPIEELDQYLRLIDRVKNRMTSVVVASTGTDNLFRPGDEISFRESQLQRMKNGEIVDMESLKNGASIADLGLGEYALALQKYIAAHPEIEKIPPGIHAVIEANPADGLAPGVVFVLRNNSDAAKVTGNCFHPFYTVYVSLDGTLRKGPAEAKQIIELLRRGCENRDKPIAELCRIFNKETRDGYKMNSYSKLLSKAIEAISEQHDEDVIDSLFTDGETTALKGDVAHLSSYELIAFFVVKEAPK